MKPNLIQAQALYLLQQLRAGKEPQGGMLYYDKIVQCRLDNSLASIDRLGQLLNAMHKQGLRLEKIFTHQKHKNLLLTIAVYIVDYIGKNIDDTANWYSTSSYNEIKDSDAIPEYFPFSIVAEFMYGISLPFGGIYDAIDNGVNIVNYINSTIDTLLEKSRVNLMLPASDVSNSYLKKVRTGKFIGTNIAYEQHIKQINFDYSLNSLKEVDKLLEHIKKTVQTDKKPLLSDRKDPYDLFVMDGDNQALIIFLGCYIGMTATLLAKASAKWYDHADIQQMLPDEEFIFSIEHSMVLVYDQAYMMLPIMAVTNYLFKLNPDSSMGAVSFAHNIMNNNKGNMTSYRFGVDTIDYTIPKSWQEAMKQAGWLTSFSMFHAHDGGMISTTSIKSDSNTITSHIDSQPENIIERMNIPTPDIRYEILNYDIYANVPMGRTDAIAVRVKVYTYPRLTLDLFVPYRHADSPMGFAIFPVIHLQSPKDSPQAMCIPELVQAFYESAQSFVSPYHNTDLWSVYYIDKHDVFAPPKWSESIINSFDPDNSEITVYPVIP